MYVGLLSEKQVRRDYGKGSITKQKHNQNERAIHITNTIKGC